MKVNKGAIISLVAITGSFGMMLIQPVAADSLPYTVTNGSELDAQTYNGFKLFRNWCARCHGSYGQGMIGPDLAASLKLISRQQFMQTVAKGKTGKIGSMPAWKANKNVMAGRDDIYRYLKARSDGMLGEIKPKKVQ